MGTRLQSRVGVSWRIWKRCPWDHHYIPSCLQPWSSP
jgi:hypothetical protein